MEHEEAQEALWEFYDGELPLERRSSFESHLAACGECRQELAAWREASSRLFRAQAPANEAETAAFARRVMAAVKAKAESRPAWSWLAPRWLAPAFGLGLAAALLLAAPASSPRDPAVALLLTEPDGAGFFAWLSGPPPSRTDALSLMEGAAR
ncbi:MAG: zf-HC2 domain-containing protein [Elusimicrobia bacterium]|nr:zf-HC2 domain-containing protein [Elusimicrobiota bacterium]MDE2425963.1 zf-HC2 domain-containing protein [Elusimicrobiota bacterium]